MKRAFASSLRAALLLAVALPLAACGGKSSSSPAEGAAAADLPPRLQQEGAAATDAPPPYPPAEDEPLLENAPVVGATGGNQGGQAQAGQSAQSAGALSPEERARLEQGSANEQQHVAALIPNQGPYNPIRELTRVNFGFDTDELAPQAKRTLDRNAQWLLAHPDVQVRVEGHCDERGTNEYNLGLGQRRADRVVAYLVGMGVSARMLHPVSFGEEVPLVSGHAPEVWAQNRRVDFSHMDDEATGATMSVPMQAQR